MIRALRDLAWLAVLIAAGTELGVLFEHVAYVRGTTWAFAYTGAALFVGFGLVNRLLRHTDLFPILVRFGRSRSDIADVKALAG